jgi:hypothetical protein
MKKIIPGLILISLLALLVAPVTVKAQAMVDACTIRNSKTSAVLGCTGLGVGSSALYVDYAICCLMDKIYQVADWIFLILMALVIIFILYGGFLIITAGGSEEKVTKGKTYITWALVGFVIAILARALPNIAYYFVK